MAKRAKQSFAFSVPDGAIVVVSEDDVYADDHPYVRSRPAMFRDLSEELVIAAPVRRGLVEQATAAPGEKRNR